MLNECEEETRKGEPRQQRAVSNRAMNTFRPDPSTGLPPQYIYVQIEKEKYMGTRNYMNNEDMEIWILDEHM